MSLKEDLIDAAIMATAARLKVIERHSGMIADCEALLESLRDAVPSIDWQPIVSHASESTMRATLMVVAARESEISAAIDKANLRVVETERHEHGSYALRYKLHGIETTISVCIRVDELDELNVPAQLAA